MVGGIKGFDSLFPTPAGATNTGSSVAIQAGFGVDIKLKKHLELRPAEVSWVRMQLPNTTTYVQNDLRVSAGIVLRY
jgi:peptidoglycan-associated lipoprotein